MPETTQQQRQEIKQRLYELWDNWRFHKFFSKSTDNLQWITEEETKITTDTELRHRIMIQWCIDRNHLQ